MLKVLEKLKDIQRAAAALRRALTAFTGAGERKAFNTWKTLQSRRSGAMQSTVWLAAQRGHRVAALQEMLEALDPSEIDELIRSTDELGMTPLLWSAKRGFGDTVEVLLAFGGDRAEVIAAQDADGATALHHACRKGHNEIAQLLIAAGAPTNAVNHDKSTPLHWAARKNNVAGLRSLINSGADLDVKNKWGATALDNAKFADHMEAIALLATDQVTRKAAENKLILERKLRPTEEERAAKLAELAGDALARREANKARLEGISSVREAAEMAAKEKAQLERRQRTADKTLAAAMAAASGLTSRSSGGGGLFGGQPQVDPVVETLERAVQEARDAGNGETKGSLAERLRVAEGKIAQLSAGDALSTTSRQISHRSPGGAAQESPIERTLRRQKLAAMKKR